MVLRSSDRPTGIVDNMAAANERINEVQRAQGRGGSALRAGDNVVTLKAEAATPMLLPLGMDSAVTFTPDGKVAITDATGAQDRDMTVRDLASSGTLTADGGLHTDGNAYAFSQNVGDGGLLSSGTVNASNFHTDGDSYAFSHHVGAGGIASLGTVNGTSLHTDGDSYAFSQHVGAGGVASLGTVNATSFHTDGDSYAFSHHVGAGGVASLGTVAAGAFHTDGDLYAFSQHVGAGGIASLGTVNGTNFHTDGDLYAFSMHVGAGNLLVNGMIQASANCYAPLWISQSDEVLKDNIASLDEGDALAAVRALRPREFTRRADPDQRASLGFVAQELPERFQVPLPEGEMLGYDVTELVAAAVAAVQHLDAKVNEQAEQIAALTARLDALEAA